MKGAILGDFVAKLCKSAWVNWAAIWGEWDRPRDWCISLLGGGPHPVGEGEVLGVFDVHLLVWDLPLRHWQRAVFGSCEKIW